MTIETLKNSARLFVEGKLSAEEFSAIFEEFHGMYFDYQKIKSQDSKLADLIEEINEDISRYEVSQELRASQPDYYINDAQLRESVSRVVII